MATRREKPDDRADDLARVIEEAAQYDDGAAARMHLTAGRAIYYSDADTPADLVIKKYPDGRREFVRFDLDGEHRVEAKA